MRAKDRILYFFFPPYCVGCQEVLRIENSADPPVFCPVCRKRWLDEINKPCECCGDFISACTVLPRGMNKPGYFAHIKLAYYMPARPDTMTGRLLFGMKRRSEKRYYEFAAENLTVRLCLFLRECRILPSDCLFTYVPRLKKSVARFGTDQAREIALRIARNCEGECPNGLILRHGGKEQKTLNAKERFPNMRKALSLNPKLEHTVKGKTAVIVDDLLTTGASVSAIADILIKKGAKGVIFVTLAVTE